MRVRRSSIIANVIFMHGMFTIMFKKVEKVFRVIVITAIIIIAIIAIIIIVVVFIALKVA